MPFIIADTFTDSLTRLDPADKGAVAAAAFDVKANPANPGFQLHRLDGIREKRFWSARVTRDLRLILYRDGDTTVVCYADHHDAAYAWAERRRLDVNAVTGAAQFVAIEERQEEVVHEIHTAAVRGPALFDRFPDAYLLSLGVPEMWLQAVKAADEPLFLGTLVTELPEEASEALLRLATGEAVARPAPASVAGSDPFRHPDARRRFRIIEDDRVLAQALAAPWDKWVVFLHPTQQTLVDRGFRGPARVTGGAGTGKTVVALHRAARLARDHPEARVLLTTFSRTLAARLQQHLERLLGEDARELDRIRVAPLHQVAVERWTQVRGRPFRLANRERLDALLERSLARSGPTDLPSAFLRAEFDVVVNAEGITSWEQYRSLRRVGRGVALGARQRFQAWAVFEQVLRHLEEEGSRTYEQICHEVADVYAAHQHEAGSPSADAETDGAPASATDADGGSGRYDHVVADEIQDFGPAELRLLRALAGPGGTLFLAGDLGQRIYKGPTSFARAGIEVRGRSTRLRLNYRTTEQIRRYADGILPAALDDPDADGPEGRDAVSLFSGPEPEIERAPTQGAEVEAVTAWLKTLISNGYAPSDIAIFARTNDLVGKRARHVVGNLGLRAHLLRDDEPREAKRIAIGTMHRAKGLEFKVVVVMGCEDRYLPNRYVLNQRSDDVDRATFVEQERNLFYVACTRARERLLVTCGGPPSPFLKTP